MKLNPETRARIMADLVLDVDPASSTIEIKIDETWYLASWLAPATTQAVSTKRGVVTRWYRTAITTGYFCGPDAIPAGATVLELGLHDAKTRVTVDGDQLVADDVPVEVK